MIRYLATTLALTTLWLVVAATIIDAATDAAAQLSAVRVAALAPNEEHQ